MSEIIRPRLIGLPVQRSAFRDLSGIGTLLGLAEVLPGRRFDARVDDEGNLWLDRSQARLLAEAFLAGPSEEAVRRVDGILRGACRELLARTEQLASVPAGIGGADRIRAIAPCLWAITPFPIMTKFVPEMLLEALREIDDRPPPFPDPSPGLRLSAALLALAREAHAAGYPLDRLSVEWPEIDPAVAARVRAFCTEQTGFGPVTWDAPGYETPRMAFEAMATAFGDAEPGGIRSPLPAGTDLLPGPRELERASDGSAAGLLRSTLSLWLEYLDLEVWFLRRAFYRVVAPALPALAQELGTPPEDLLFARLDELAAELPPGGELAERRRTYLQDTAYLERNGVGEERLAEIIAMASAPSPEVTGAPR